MFENIINFFKKASNKEGKKQSQENSKTTAKERLHLVLMQDRANVSADFLEIMKQEIIDVIKKYIDIDEKEIDVKLTNKENEDGTNGAPALYANIPILNIKDGVRKTDKKENEIKEEKVETEVIENTINNEKPEDNKEVQTEENILEEPKIEECKTEETSEIMQNVTSIIEEVNSENNKENEWM